VEDFPSINVKKEFQEEDVKKEGSDPVRDAEEVQVVYIHISNIIMSIHKHCILYSVQEHVDLEEELFQMAVKESIASTKSPEISERCLDY
jgi:hypothetical protein